MTNLKLIRSHRLESGSSLVEILSYIALFSIISIGFVTFAHGFWKTVDLTKQKSDDIVSNMQIRELIRHHIHQGVSFSISSAQSGSVSSTPSSTAPFVHATSSSSTLSITKYDSTTYSFTAENIGRLFRSNPYFVLSGLHFSYYYPNVYNSFDSLKNNQIQNPGILRVQYSINSSTYIFDVVPL